MNELLCESCNSNLTIIKGNFGPHYGKVVCPKCGFKGWARNPESPKIGTTSEKRIGKKSIQDVCFFHGFIKEEFCFM
jgi:ssDNA-binding Zn-finger/Zn-ribbon topoisomerase 1